MLVSHCAWHVASHYQWYRLAYHAYLKPISHEANLESICIFLLLLNFDNYNIECNPSLRCSYSINLHRQIYIPPLLHVLLLHITNVYIQDAICQKFHYTDTFNSTTGLLYREKFVRYFFQ